MLRFSKSHLASLPKWPLQSDERIDQWFLQLREQNTFNLGGGGGGAGRPSGE